MKFEGNGMNTLINKPRANKIWFDEENLWLLLSDGRQLSVPLSYFPRLEKATPEQRNQYNFSGKGTGIHWPGLDEDISVPALMQGVGDLNR